MNVDELYLLYENSGKYFNSYDEAYINSKKPFQEKRVYYVFTPTMQKFKRVGEIERACQNYFRNTVNCDFYDIFNKSGSLQLKLIGEC